MTPKITAGLLRQFVDKNTCSSSSSSDQCSADFPSAKIKKSLDANKELSFFERKASFVKSLLLKPSWSKAYLFGSHGAFCAILCSYFVCAAPLSFAEEEDFDDDAFLAKHTSSSVKTASIPPPGSEEPLLAWSLFRDMDRDKRYVINFNNVSIVEYLRFVSKISNLNFQFNQEELNFTITVVSEEPLSLPNIVSTLIQTLRARGLNLLEQEGSLLITSSTAISQLPSVVVDGNSLKQIEFHSPLITRVFKVKNNNPASIATIIRPMMSQTAMVDISAETRQLIVTDLATNIEKITTLLESLDAPNSSLEIDTYKVRHLPVANLMAMSKQILEPFIGSNPLTFVAQQDGSAIFIVSTPYLIERSLEILEDLDTLPKATFSPSSEVFLYKITSKSGQELLHALDEICEELHDNGSQSIPLMVALENVRWIKGLNSLLFVTTPDTSKKLEEILKTLDTSSDLRNYFVYKIEKAGAEQIESSLEQLSKSLKNSSSDRDLTDAIYSMRYIKDSNSLIFTGSEDALKKLEQLLPLFDVAISEYSPTTHYWLYTPEFLNGSQLEHALGELQKNLSSSGLSNGPLLRTIQSTKWIAATNTLLFTGDPTSLNHVQAMIKLIDIPTGGQSKIFLYQPKFVSNIQIEEALDELADKLDHKNLSDRNLSQAIDNMAWIEESNTFLFKADPATIEKVEMFLKEIDNQSEALSIGNAYFVYKLKFARGSEVVAHLKQVTKGFLEKDSSQKAITHVIESISYLVETNSLLLTGSPKALEEVKTLISQFDAPGSTPALEKTSFFIYKTQHISPLELKVALQATATDLRQSGLIDPLLLESIDTLRVVEMTGSVIFTGSKESLDKTKEIISSIDIASSLGADLGEFQGHSFFIYKLRYVSMQEMINLLSQFTSNLEKEGLGENPLLSKAIKSAKELKDTNSILFTGPTAILEKIAELIKQLDIPESGEGDMSRQRGSYLIYKPTHVSGPELIDMLKDFEENLRQSGIQDFTLYDTIDNLKYIVKTGYILVSGDQQSIDKVQELLRKFDTTGNQSVTSLSAMGTSFLVYKLHYHNGKELQETLKKIGEDLKASEPKGSEPLMRAINSIQWIKITNSLLATGSSEVLTQLKELIENIDIPLRQVFIEVLIIETSLSNNQQFGLQWGSKVQFLNRVAAGVSNIASPNPATGSQANTSLAAPLALVNATRTPLGTDIASGGGFDLGVIGDIILHKGQTFLSLASLVNALQQDNDSVIVMNPKLIAQDNQQSTIFVGQNIPFGGSLVSTTQTVGSQEITNIEYRDVGINLTITPILGRSDVVTLDIYNEITAQVENTTADVQNLQGLQTSRTALTARVHVPNKHFVALSGMIQDTKSHFKSSIPCLGGLPLIGAFFSENDRFNSRDNIIFFLRPVIIDSLEEYKKITENQECLYKELGVKQIVKEEIDEGIDWVKQPEDE